MIVMLTKMLTLFIELQKDFTHFFYKANQSTDSDDSLGVNVDTLCSLCNPVT